MRYKLITLFGLLTFFVLPVLAQIPTGTGSTNPPNNNPIGDLFEKDTFNFSYFFIENPDIQLPFNDTLLNNFFEYHDPVKRKPLERINLGNVGSASRPVFYESRFHRGFEIGLNAYEPYSKNPKDLPFYKLKKAYTSAYYVQGNTQNNNYFEGKFSRNFDNNINFSLDYMRLNDDGDYQNQNAKNTAFSFGFYYDGKDGKYDAALIVTTNVVEQENNGGLDTTAFNVQNTQREITAPTFLNGEIAKTRYDHKNFAFNHFYNFSPAPSPARKPRVFKINHFLNYRTGYYKYSDTSPAADSSYYQNFQVNDNGIRMFISDNSLENSFTISTSKSGSNNETGETTQKDRIEVGLTNIIHWIGQEPLDTRTLNNVLLTGKIDFNPSENLKINTYGHYNLIGSNFSDYYLKGDLALQSKKIGLFKAQFINQLYSPNLINNKFYVSEILMWDNDFKKTFESTLTGSFSIPQWEFEVSGSYHVLTNFIYYDALANPVQHEPTISIPQLVVKKNVKLGNFHLDNLVAFQSTPKEVMRLPSFYSRHSLYFEGYAFKKAMFTRLGFDLRMHGNYFGDNFHPLVGQFYLQDDFENKLYPMIDFFLNYRVGQVRGFVKFENLIYFLKNDFYFQTASHATPFTVFRFSLNWRFLG